MTDMIRSMRAPLLNGQLPLHIIAFLLHHGSSTSKRGIRSTTVIDGSIATASQPALHAGILFVVNVSGKTGGEEAYRRRKDQEREGEEAEEEARGAVGVIAADRLPAASGSFGTHCPLRAARPRVPDLVDSRRVITVV
mmetsp:Transcript_19133/g.41699  ORF Transcript_19133/g.41699 Transcript_19133/m.41699 type:complete len:138 (-) Transcript_19133:74-487(-)